MVLTSHMYSSTKTKLTHHIIQLWGENHQPTMGGEIIMQPWVGGGGRQPTMVGVGNHHAAMGDRVPGIFLPTNLF